MTTRKAHRLTLMFFILSIMASFGPCLYGVVRAFIEGSVVSKYSLGIVGVACIIIALVAALNKYRPRCIPWLLFIAIHICVGDVMPIIIAVGIGIVVDEFIFTPAYKFFRKQYEMQKQGDIICQKMKQ